jgi:TM2 domain-containing membrane protein YozV
MKSLTILTIIFISFISLAKAQEITDDDIIPSEKSPATAFACSLVIPGLGQMYNEEVGKGFTFFGGALFGSGLIVLGSDQDDSIGDLIYDFGFIVASVCYIYSLIDAPLTAQKITKESRIKNAKRLKKVSSIFDNDNNNFSININPYIRSSCVGVGLNISF